MKLSTIIIFPLLSLVGAQVFSAGDLSRNNPEKVVIEMGTNIEGMYFKPDYLEFQTGKAYKLILKNTDTINHEIEVGGFAEKVFTRKVEVKDKAGNLLADIKGSVRKIEIGPNSEVEWYIVPIQTGEDLVMECAIPGHKEAGMTGIIDIN